MCLRSVLLLWLVRDGLLNAFSTEARRDPFGPVGGKRHSCCGNSTIDRHEETVPRINCCQILCPFLRQELTSQLTESTSSSVDRFQAAMAENVPY
jgi:hypothetical protein